MELFLVLSFVVGLCVSTMLIPRIVLISNNKRLFDEPNGRSSHSQAVPRLGGVSFLPGLTLSVCTVLGFRMVFGMGIEDGFGTEIARELLFFASGLLLMYLIGVADDLNGVKFTHKFVYQILAASAIIAGGVYVNDFHGIFGIHEIPLFIGYLATILLVVFVINAINLIDGVDGLASGLSAVPLTVFGLWFWKTEWYIYSMMALGMLGTLIPFFIFNVFGKRHKLFMGDTGSLILGFLIAFLSAKFCMLNVNPTTYGIQGSPVLILSLLFIPLFDATRVFIVRMMKGHSPFLPDRNHIHHKFLDMGFSHKQTMMTLIGSAFLFVGFNFLILPFVGASVMLIFDVLSWMGLMQVLHRIGIILKIKKSRIKISNKKVMS